MAYRPPRFLRSLIALGRWNARDDEMEREMALHLNALTAEYVRAGMSETEAAQKARARFGNVLRLKEQGHDIRIGRVVEDVRRDLKHTARGLWRSPGFTFAVILTLALGIGGNTAIFSVVDQLLLRPLPYPEGEKLVMVYERFLRGASGSAPTERLRNGVSPANWLDWQRDSSAMSSLAVWRSTTNILSGVGEPARVNMQLVSWEFFPLLGVQPLLGRTITPTDDKPQAPRVAVLSHQFWQGRFGGDPNLVGRVIRLNDNPVEVIGVMPAGFRFVEPENDLWMAFRLDRARAWRETAGRFINVVGRIKPEESLGTARAEMETLARRLATTYTFNQHTSVSMVPLRQELTGQVYSSLVALYAAVGVLLSIACFNVANLLLARAASRRREIAIRTSLGAGRLAIIRQLLVESLLLAAVGGAIGVALARACLDAIVAFAPADLLRVPELYIDWRVLSYAFGLSMLTGVIVGLVPAILVARESMVAAIRSSGYTVTHAPRIRQLLVVCQVALTVMLLSGAGMLVRTMIALNAANTGFDKRGVLTMEIGLPGSYPPERRVQFYRTALETLRALPGVHSAAAADSLAMIGSPTASTAFHRRGTPELPANEAPTATIRIVTPGYFRTLGIPVLRGREFTAADEASPAPGFVVNDAFVKTYLTRVDPLNATISVAMQKENPYAPIIGVVGNVSEGSVRDSAQPTVFYSHRQMPEETMTIVVRVDQPAGLAAAARDTIRRADPNVPVTTVRTFEHALSESLARERLNALVSGGFALTGLILASLGLYGLLAFLVTERTKEIGIRIALGESLGRLKRSVISSGLRLVAVGAAVGLGASFVLLRSLRTLLFGVTPTDVSTYVIVLAVLTFVATLASYLPARWAARVEPLKALRQD
jgi:putative ABC transport system permease protein